MLVFVCVLLLSAPHAIHIQARHRVLVVGGAGRVGGSAVRALLKRYPSAVVDVGGRSEASWAECRRRIHAPESVRFLSLDIANQTRLAEVIPNYDLIVHTAGPFQGLRDPLLLRETIKQGKRYIDVCDDVPMSCICRGEDMRAQARASGAVAVISTGIWPGGSSLLAQEVIAAAGGKPNVRNVTFSFFTAGSGGAGPTILTATFLILGEDVITYVAGKRILRKSATDGRLADFGRDIGAREVVRLSLIECESCYQSGIDTVETFFGTAPPFWNTLFGVMARVIPQKVLQNRILMKLLADVSLPMVRLVDSLVGSTNGIRVDVCTKSGEVVTGLMTHRDLEQAVGDSIASFAHQLLEGDLPSGVFFPEEVPGEEFRRQILQEMSSTAITYSISSTSPTAASSDIDYASGVR